MTLTLNDWQTDNRHTDRQTDRHRLTSTHQRLKCLPSWGNLSWKKPKIRLWSPHHFNWQPDCVYVTAFLPIWNGGKEKILQLCWHLSRGPQNIYFSTNYPLYYLHCFHFRSWDTFGRKKYCSSAAISQIGSRLDKISGWKEWRHGIMTLLAGYSSKWRQQCQSNSRLLWRLSTEEKTAL